MKINSTGTTDHRTLAACQVECGVKTPAPTPAPQVIKYHCNKATDVCSETSTTGHSTKAACQADCGIATPAPTKPSTPKPTTKSGGKSTNAWAIAGPIVGVVVIGGIVAFWAIRRRSQQGGSRSFGGLFSSRKADTYALDTHQETVAGNPVQHETGPRQP